MPDIDIRNRVKELRVVRAGDILPNPKNWRQHPEAQRQAYAALVKSIGFAGALLTRELDDGRLMLLDGHLRQDENPDASLPALVTDLNETEADLLLATYDPLAAMAEADQKALADLFAAIQTDDAAIQGMLNNLARGFVVATDDDWNSALGGLADGDRAPFQQMTFTLHDDQAEMVKRALEAAKNIGTFVDTGNENSNGNALALVCELFLGDHG